MLSIFYGIVSALSWGAGDFAGGLASRKLGAYRAVFFSELAGLVLLFILALFNPEEIPPFSSLFIAVLAGILGSGGLLILYHSMTHGQMSIAAPVSALFAAVLPVVISMFTEGVPVKTQLVGFGLALTAVWLISQGDAPGSFQWRHLSDLSLPLLSGLGFGAYFILMHYATEGVSSIFWPMIASRSAGTLMMFFFVLRRRESFGVARNAWGLVLANALFDVGGNFFYLSALQTGRLGVSAVLSSLYPGGTVLLAWVFLKEKISPMQWAGILTALAAIALFTV